MNFGFWTASGLADILFDDQYGRYFLGLFSLLCSFSLLVLFSYYVVSLLGLRRS